MKSCGVIAEYNPFHNGHRFQLKEAREKTGSDVMIVAMSGNFLQRGEPAVLDKWQRAELALTHGADLVVEQSVLGSSQASDLFAKAGIRLLNVLQCDCFSFGAEEGNAEEFQLLAELILQKETEIDRYFQTIRNDGRSYPAQMEEAISAAADLEFLPLDLSSPNNQLGIAYMKENLKLEKPMAVAVVKREGAGHHDEVVDTGSAYASGTAIREMLLNGPHPPSLLEKWVPSATAAAAGKGSLATWEQYWPYLRYRLLSLQEDELRAYYQVEEGMEYRLKKFAKTAPDFKMFLQAVKNKRWTWARLQRTCLYILLGIQPEDVRHFFSHPPAVRILGFTEQGSRYLNQLKKEQAVPFISNINQQNKEDLAVEIHSDEIYQIGLHLNIKEQNYARSPIRVK